MGIDWYDMIARRNGGYKGRAKFTIVGRSAEDIFEERLIQMLPEYQFVLDAGCGHGEFTLKMSPYANRIIGLDNSSELLHIAQQLLASSTATNVKFVYASTKGEMPFQDGQFDLIYDRRGPTSIIKHSNLLVSGGVIFGIHTNVDKVKVSLVDHGYQDIEIEEYNSSITYFPNIEEYAKFLSDVPGNPDYTLPQYRDEVERMADKNIINGRLGHREHKFIWKAVKP